MGPGHPNLDLYYLNTTCVHCLLEMGLELTFNGHCYNEFSHNSLWIKKKRYFIFDVAIYDPLSFHSFTE